MYKIIGGDQKEYGPVSAEEIHHWIADGRLSAESWARAENEQQWKALASFPEFAAALATQPRLAVRPPPVPAFSGAPPRVGIGSCLSRGFKLLKANFVFLYGCTFVIWIITFACSFVPGAEFFFLVLKGALYGGLYLVFLKRIRGEPASLGDVFATFHENYIQLMLVGLVTSVVVLIGNICCLFLPGVYFYVAWIFAIPLVADRRTEFWSGMELSRKTVTRVWFPMLALIVLAALPSILMDAAVYFKIGLESFPAFREIISAAMSSATPDAKKLNDLILHVTKENFVIIILSKVVWLLNWPVFTAALMYAYEDLFGVRKSPGN
jgi:hypothetical protein